MGLHFAFIDGGARLSRKLYDEARATSELALDLDGAAVTLDDPEADRQAEARAAHVGFRGEERLQDPVEALRRDAGAGVGDFDLDCVADDGRPDRPRPTLLPYGHGVVGE